jgi:glucosamine--fructose-6-phosphate aminotransferase (isomerizing)
MCGIIGVTGAAEPLQLMLDALALLEYRGYDSAGVVLVDDDRLWRKRGAVRGHSLETLREAAPDAPAHMTAGIGHTRWATHGAAVERNAHPHCDCSGTVAIVHNGIIENYQELWGKLAAEGHTRSSETDSEVVAHLLERELATGAGLAEALRRCVGELRGDFALAAVTTREPQVIAAARRTSPLILGRIDGIGLVASDIAALLGTTRDLYQLADDEIAEVRPDSISCRSRSDGTSSPLGATAMTTSCRKRSTSSRGHSQTPSWEGFTPTAPPSSRSSASPAPTSTRSSVSC